MQWEAGCCRKTVKSQKWGGTERRRNWTKLVISASKLAERKAAQVARTPKLRSVRREGVVTAGVTVGSSFDVEQLLIVRTAARITVAVVMGMRKAHGQEIADRVHALMDLSPRVDLLESATLRIE
jgi:hypothetical protein